jgi:small conductance mechanosensitive channel
MRLVQRTRTLGTILQNIVNVVVAIVALVLVTNLLAPDLVGSLTLLTAAIGAGLGFGAQNIVKDVLNGLFIVAEDQIGIGDMVDMGLATGVVEYVAVRITHVRDVNGTLWYVRNGEVTRIGNMSQGWARAIVDIGVPVDADVPIVEEALLEAAQGLAKDAKWRTRIIERPEVWGLESMTGEALVIRVVMKTRANAMDDVARELRMRLKDAVQKLDLSVPSLESVVPDGIAGARRVRGANPPKTRPNAVTGVPPVSRGIWRKKNPKPASPPDEPEVGGYATFERIVEVFYREVAQDPVLKPMYPEEDLGPAAERLTMFLVQYWGGPSTYSERRGHPRLRMRHIPFRVDPDARERWLRCMRIALDEAQLSPLHDATLWDYLERAAYAMVNTLPSEAASPGVRPTLDARSTSQDSTENT